MNSVETSISSSTSNFSEIGNGIEASTSSSTKIPHSNASAELSIDRALAYIEDILSAITNKNSASTMVDSGLKLKNMVEPLTADFSKLCEGISQGAKMFSDQKFLTNSLSSEAHTMAVDVLKGVGNAHWAAAGLLAVANVLERLDKISSNDRDCIDLLKGMLDLAKYIKMVKDLDADFHREISRKMSEAVHLIVSGAILCHSFIRCNRITKFLTTKKICEELVYLRGKVDRMKIDIVLLMNHMILCSLTFHQSKQQHRTNDDGSLNRHYTNDTGETPDRFETIITITSETVCVETPSQEFGNLDISNKKNSFQLRERLLRTLIAFGEYFKHTANGLRKTAGHRFEECRKPVHTLSMQQKKSSTVDSLSVEQETDSINCLLGEDNEPVEHGFTFEELMTATNGFRKLLGQGGFGFTYRGILSDGRHAVIKRSRDQGSSLQRELECITNLQHPNILNLVGSCIHGNELLLVYDYMPNGNLSNLLFEPRDNQVLDWPTRRKIINGVVSALVYLQECAHVCIVHRDIKPTNILIDEDFNAKVSDFGIARKLPIGKTMGNNKGEQEGVYVDFEEESNDPHHSTGAAGTVGYVAPECIRTGHVTRKADIYSVGLLMLNLVSGKRCIEIDGATNKMQSLVLLANELSDEDRLSELIDPRLLITRGFESESILRTTQLALLCTRFQPEYRPTASDMFKFLSSSSPFHFHDSQEQQQMI